jgi:hypothetical protein
MGNSVAMKPNKITLEQSLLQEIFEYKDGNLYRKNNVIAGGLHGSGYRQIKVNNISYPAHRLIWVYCHGSIDENMQIDHINGVKDDNRIENLRLVTAQQNCFNRSRLNSKGYTWNKAEKKWQSSIWLNGKLKYLGLYTNEQDARNVYLDNCKTYHKEFSI